MTIKTNIKGYYKLLTYRHGAMVASLCFKCLKSPYTALTFCLLFTSNASAFTQAFTHKDMLCMAVNIYFEARSESEKGQLAVGQITLNRARLGRKSGYKDSICGVVFQKNQFSWTRDKSLRLKLLSPAFSRAKAISKMVLVDGVHIPDLRNAVNYHADYIDKPNTVSWRKMILIGSIGTHIFYYKKEG